MTDINIMALVNQYLSFIPNLSLIIMALGWIVIIMTVVDYIVPDSIDHGFTKVLYNLPVIGKVFKFLLRASLLRSGLEVKDGSFLSDATKDEVK